VKILLSTYTYDQPFRKISYGMLIDADSNTKTGYNGADYDFYVQSAGGKLIFAKEWNIN
jgi:hypothetical protein